ADIKDQQIRATGGDGVHNEGTVRDDVAVNVESLGEDLAERVRDVRVILCYEDVFHATSSAMIRRKRRSLTQILQVHMAAFLCTHRATWHVRCSGGGVGVPE